MSDTPSLINQVFAKVRALLRADWRSRSGEKFRETVRGISEFASEKTCITNETLSQEVVRLGRQKLEGAASKELAAATRDFAEAEQKSIESELQRRSLESKVRKEAAEARFAEVKALDAELELYKKLKEAGVVLREGPDHTLTLLAAPPGYNLDDLSRRRSLALSDEAISVKMPADESSHSRNPKDGRTGLAGTVVAVTADSVLLDIGYKIEGILSLAEVQTVGETVVVGDKMMVFIKGRNSEGYYSLSRFE
jgi:hypothetical protein